MDNPYGTIAARFATNEEIPKTVVARGGVEPPTFRFLARRSSAGLVRVDPDLAAELRFRLDGFLVCPASYG